MRWPTPSARGGKRRCATKEELDERHQRWSPAGRFAGGGPGTGGGDLGGLSLREEAVASARPGDGVRGRGRRRPDRAPPRQSHILVPVAQVIPHLRPLGRT